MPDELAETRDVLAGAIRELAKRIAEADKPDREKAEALNTLASAFSQLASVWITHDQLSGRQEDSFSTTNKVTKEAKEVKEKEVKELDKAIKELKEKDKETETIPGAGDDSPPLISRPLPEDQRRAFIREEDRPIVGEHIWKDTER